VTVTVIEEDVSVFGAPVLSVATAASVYVPGLVGVHVTEKGALWSVPIDAPFTRKSTWVILPLALAVAFADIVIGVEVVTA
jgi:hypothetical protein